MLVDDWDHAAIVHQHRRRYRKLNARLTSLRNLIIRVPPQSPATTHHSPLTTLRPARILSLRRLEKTINYSGSVRVMGQLGSNLKIKNKTPCITFDAHCPAFLKYFQQLSSRVHRLGAGLR